MKRLPDSRPKENIEESESQSVKSCIIFFRQAGGAGIMAQGNSSSIKTGENVIIGGLIVQIVFFGMFIVVESFFHNRVLKHPNECAMITRNIPSQLKNWDYVLLTLLVALFLYS
ncbi:DEHA2F26950p [Debaryomyces hansenii CBS767]|uniref:DEHA2F26950p n=1 Tax=Debaryomyces hansenii (strain ATCC 36239 / CBS 767 / BCRC 21394 / JCM 1990 / NBRC 0083 / IGC 2968) TaxID=284592 RepID=W0TYU4_DEBHA|nr:DEHA2F26950p [Debaryomyces hansenii CBS767]CAG89938.2 DEHA2F26950p [Debaryomyces hansenii CBS767]|eukprot:XP_002770909.1 DEHA2F26950p [Debaryomyces hansenii CBS767]